MQKWKFTWIQNALLIYVCFWDSVCWIDWNDDLFENVGSAKPYCSLVYDYFHTFEIKLCEISVESSDRIFMKLELELSLIIGVALTRFKGGSSRLRTTPTRFVLQTTLSSKDEQKKLPSPKFQYFPFIKPYFNNVSRSFIWKELNWMLEPFNRTKDRIRWEESD